MNPAASAAESSVRIRPVAPSDRAAWLEMRRALWPEDDGGDHAHDIDRFFAGERRLLPLEVLIAVDERGTAAGFAELSIRPYAEGCVTDRVAYLEGWYVEPWARRQGIGRRLVAAAEEWARAQGCSEFASDALLDNETSAAAHRALGFVEVECIRCFRKLVAPGDDPAGTRPAGVRVTGERDQESSA